MKRYLEKYISEDLQKKIVLLTGPRQTGKTTLSKMLTADFDYFNYDSAEDRLSLLEKSWDRSREVLIFDELHKLKNWKSWLKGIYDTEGVPPAIIVTGSAKLDTYRKAGDSLAGRFFQFRLHPLDLKEINDILKPEDLDTEMDKLLLTGGFPEPFLVGTTRFYKRWKKSHLDIIIKQDLLDLENVQQINTLETLIQLLRKRVGSPVSYSSLSRDLQCSDKTIKRWMTILESLYVVFRVSPYHRNIARSILKAPKFYFYDTGQVIGDDGVKLENLVACSLLKEIHFRSDCYGDNKQLYYIRNKEGREIDFCVASNEIPEYLIEVKWNNADPSPNFRPYQNIFRQAKTIQLVRDLQREKTYPGGIEIRKACQWLANLTF
ncbi:ATP-binding protein [bacterium]|nr:ATP-binding protein [bacterium]